MNGHLITETNITLMLDGEIFQIERKAPVAARIIEALKRSASTHELRQIMNPKAALKDYTGGRITINQYGHAVYQGTVLPKAMSDRMLALMQEGLKFGHLLKFIERVENNPSFRATQELYEFLEHRGLPITQDGTFLAYKGVNPERWSISGNTQTRVVRGVVDERGRILNTDGATIEVKRQDVDDDRERHCSCGLHVGTLEYASGFGPVVVLCEVDPADVVSVPSDCACQKLRTSKYKVLKEAQGLIKSAVVSQENPYAQYRDYPVDDLDDDDPDFLFEDQYEDEDEDEDEGYEAAPTACDEAAAKVKTAWSKKCPVCQYANNFEKYGAEPTACLICGTALGARHNRNS